MSRTFRYWSIAIDDMTPTDLREETKENMMAFLIEILDEETPRAEGASALYDPETGRLGIAYGADATWADVDDVESGIEMWLNDGEMWERRN